MAKRQALVIGINEYPFGDSLSTAAEDAEKIAKLLEEYGSFEVHRLPSKEDFREVDGEANVDLKEVEDAITQLFLPKSGMIPETSLLFFAGHGWRREKNGQPEGFLVTSDAVFEEDSEDGLFSLKRLHQILKDSPVRQQIVWLDCCHSGELFNFIDEGLDEFEQQRDFDRCFIAACREFQIAYGGVLTPALLQGLNPTNKDDGRVTNYTLRERLESLLNNAPQHSVIRNTGSQIILTQKGGVRGNICPYKGLNYFDFNPTKPQEAEDHRYFYGRTDLTNQLLVKVASSNFLAVIGASGSGKSSVVRAGLLYQLYLGNRSPLKNKIPGSDRWTFYPPFTPGTEPLGNLQQVLGINVKTADDLVNFIERTPSERVVMVVDQFEEVFAPPNKDKRQDFFECLIGAVERLGNKLCLVLMMRDDFHQHNCEEQDYAGLANKIDDNFVRVKRMNRQELQEVILKPAELVELEIDGDLVNEMIADVSDSSGDLALLQYALTQLWENSSFNLLTISDYSRLGGVQKALGNHADTVYNSLSPEEQKAARRIFLELTRLSEDENTPNTRQQVWLKDLVNSQQSEELVNNVVKCLADKKLVVTSEQELEGQRVAVVNIVHETLIRDWGLLDGWLKESREALIIKQPIEDAAKKWRDRGKPKEAAYLLQGRELVDAENFRKESADKLPLSILEQEFVEASIKNRQKNHRFMAFGGILSGVVLIFAGIAGVNWRGAESQRQIVFAGRLANQADLIREQQPELIQRSVLLAMESMKHSRSPEGEEALRSGLGLLPHAVKNINHLSEVKAVSFDGKYQALVNKENTLAVLDIKSQKEVAQVQHNDSVGYADFSANNKYLVIASTPTASKNIVKVLDISNQQQVFQIQLDEPVYGVSFSPDSKYLAVAGFDNTAIVLEASSGRQVLRIKHATRLNKVIFSPDSQYFATIVDDWVPVSDDTPLRTVRLFEITTGREVIKMKHDSSLWDLVFSPNGKYIGTASNDGTARVWEIKSGREVGRLTHEGPVSNIVFSFDSKYLATASTDGSSRVLDIANRKIISRMNHKTYLTNVAFSTDNKYLATYSREKHTIQLWDIAGQKEVSRIANVSDIWKLTISSDGKYLLTTTEYDNADYNTDTKSAITRVWEVISGQTVVTITHTGERIYKTIFSPDSKRLATQAGGIVRRPIGGLGIIRVWDITNGKEIFTTNQELELGKKLYFSSDSEYLTASLWDESLRSWEISSGKEVAPISQENQTTDSKLSPDGKYQAVEGDSVVYVQLRNPDTLLTEACNRLTRNLTQEEWIEYLPSEGYRKTCPNLP